MHSNHSYLSIIEEEMGMGEGEEDAPNSYMYILTSWILIGDVGLRLSNCSFSALSKCE